MRPNPYDALPTVPSFHLDSPDVADGAELRADHRSDAGGGNQSPALDWSGFPDATRSFAITMLDVDAPTPSGFWHWAVFNVPPAVRALPRHAGSADGTRLPAGAVQLPNDVRLAQYIGAGPPPGTGTHRYLVAVHALDVDTLPVPRDATPAYLSFVMLGHTLARAVRVVTATAR